MALLSAIDKEKFQQYTTIENLVEIAKLYANPDLYKAERESNKNIENSSKRKVHNSFYEQISRDSRNAGKCILPKELSSVIENLYKEKVVEKPTEKMNRPIQNNEDVVLG